MFIICCEINPYGDPAYVNNSLFYRLFCGIYNKFSADSSIVSH